VTAANWVVDSKVEWENVASTDGAAWVWHVYAGHSAGAALSPGNINWNNITTMVSVELTAPTSRIAVYGRKTPTGSETCIWRVDAGEWTAFSALGEGDAFGGIDQMPYFETEPLGPGTYTLAINTGPTTPTGFLYPDFYEIQTPG
jgi:hypothetical protein